ncbi:MAG: glycoside hydrolase family 13 protein [Nocardioidaceae bacterium]
MASQGRPDPIGTSSVTATELLPWWKTAVVYQVYIRSFADSDGDGLGDIGGLCARLPYLADLGVDALWVNPWYPSPMADAGYDVADYRDIDPVFGTMSQAEQLIEAAHSAGLRVLLDIVPNHTSAEHRWFKAALAGDVAARERYIFRPGKGVDAAHPPNDWQSNFGGTAWTRTTNHDGSAGDWYLHLFSPSQPDLDWTNPEVRGEFEDILSFWFDRDVDGFRIDVAHGLSKAPGLPDFGAQPESRSVDEPHPAWDQDDVHEIYRGWRKVADSYEPPRIFVAEAWVASNERLAKYLRPDELHTAFQFDFLRSPWRGGVMRQVIDDAAKAAGEVEASSTWVLSNHDVMRHLTRYARPQPDDLTDSATFRQLAKLGPTDLALGRQRARAAFLLVAALPGTVYIYQGEELGLEEVEDIPDELRQDPTWQQSDHTDPGRDGCRVPLPWSGEAPPFGFSPDGAAAPWLPQPACWAGLTADAQDGIPGSMLTLYREALRLRRRHLGGVSPLSWLDAPDDVLAFRRGQVECWVNTGADAVAMPAGQLLLSSAAGQSDEDTLAPDCSAWVLVS